MWGFFLHYYFVISNVILNLIQDLKIIRIKNTPPILGGDCGVVSVKLLILFFVILNYE